MPMTDTENPFAQHRHHHYQRLAALYREKDAEFARWAEGFGVIRHGPETQIRVFQMAGDLVQRGQAGSIGEVFQRLAAADRLTCAAMWLVVHMTYAERVYTDGREMARKDFKADPHGHTGGSLNMVPAYVGYLAANALSGHTRGWLMGQGHCVAAIDSVNLLVDNMEPAHHRRYAWNDQGLSRFVRDFYAYRVSGNPGRPDSPLGSHVNVHTGGGMHEGGYLGFAELQYVHMPLPDERLVAFLSDGAFEEQRGSDWAPRWWRAEDSGLVTPVMIANGRRIDQRSTLFQQGGVPWFKRHLTLNGFDPLVIDGTDPAAFAWAIRESEERLLSCSETLRNGDADYPVPLHYVIAECPKGFGFPGAGTNRAHNLPLDGNPRDHESARQSFNRGASKLFVPATELTPAVAAINNHQRQNRPREKDHDLANRQVSLREIPAPGWSTVGEAVSAMTALDRYFVDITRANPHCRVRVGNPDELNSNNFSHTLSHYKHRVYRPEEGVAEAVDGCVISALNEEAVACAALGNKGGINVVVSYEAFAIKMLGAMRQEIIFARHQKEGGKNPGWLPVPFLLTSHTWENGKNEQSHQDPTLCEALLGEMADTSVVRFPADANSAMAAMADCYRRKGEIHGLVIPKKPQRVAMDATRAGELVENGALLLEGDPGADIRLVAIGAYQLQQCRQARRRLVDKGSDAALVYMMEPGRFRGDPRDALEGSVQVGANVRERLFPHPATTLVLSHTRLAPLAGLLAGLPVLADGSAPLTVLGYRNRGGTLDTGGMLFVNQCSWLHVLVRLAAMVDRPAETWLESAELEALSGKRDPRPWIGA